LHCSVGRIVGGTGWFVLARENASGRLLSVGGSGGTQMGTSGGAAGGDGDGTRLLGNEGTRGEFRADRDVITSGRSAVDWVGVLSQRGGCWQKSFQRIFISRASMLAGVGGEKEAA